MWTVLEFLLILLGSWLALILDCSTEIRILAKQENHLSPIEKAAIDAGVKRYFWLQFGVFVPINAFISFIVYFLLRDLLFILKPSILATYIARPIQSSFLQVLYGFFFGALPFTQIRRLFRHIARDRIYGKEVPGRIDKTADDIETDLEVKEDLENSLPDGSEVSLDLLFGDPKIAKGNVIFVHGMYGMRWLRTSCGYMTDLP